MAVGRRHAHSRHDSNFFAIAATLADIDGMALVVFACKSIIIVTVVPVLMVAAATTLTTTLVMAATLAVPTAVAMDVPVAAIMVVIARSCVRAMARRVACVHACVLLGSGHACGRTV